MTTAEAPTPLRTVEAFGMTLHIYADAAPYVPPTPEACESDWNAALRYSAGSRREVADEDDELAADLWREGRAGMRDREDAERRESEI